MKDTYFTNPRHTLKLKKLMKRYRTHVERRAVKSYIAEVMNEQ